MEFESEQEEGWDPKSQVVSFTLTTEAQDSAPGHRPTQPEASDK